MMIAESNLPDSLKIALAQLDDLYHKRDCVFFSDKREKEVLVYFLINFPATKFNLELF